jgi:adenylate cyclase class IV
MARNVEIKAKLPNRDRTIGIVGKITEKPPEEIQQEDVFFLCESGRLKLRIFSPSKGELIYAVEDRTPRVYPWLNEPGGGILLQWRL